MRQTLEEHEKWFEEYVKGKIAQCGRDPAPLELKLEHTRKVLDNARNIAAFENFSPDFTNCCLLSALYHDIARFDQYIVYGTFRDGDSRNHGQMGAQILKRKGRLAEEPTEARRMILAAVCLHNRFKLPPALSPQQKIVCDVTRAADKLDILRIMDEHLSKPGPHNPTVVLSLPDNDLFSETAISAALNGKVAGYQDLRSVNDFRVLLGSWFFDISFSGAKKIFIQNGHAARLLEALPDNEIYGAVKNSLLKQYSLCN